MPPSLLLQSLEKIWPAMETAELSVAIAGGIAMSFWGHPRSTQDIDLLLMSSDSQRLASVFETLGLKRKTTTPKDLGLFHLSTWMMAMDDDYIDVEVDALVSDSSYYQKVVERFVTTKLEGMTTMTRVISREDLILHKLYAERLIDQADVISLMETHQEDLDFDYLQHWIQELKVESMWKTIQDRLPG